MSFPVACPWYSRSILALCLAGLTPVVASDGVPLHQRIDELVSEGLTAPPVGVADDATFLRRLHLDLTGSLPTADEARAFLADPSPDKRASLIDALLEHPAHARHLATSFDIWLMERRSETHVKTAEWRGFLTESLAANRPYHKLVADILSADGTEERNRSAARFYLDRQGEGDLITRDVGRLFFGRDLQCAQCHDHPNIPDYLQRDYHGLFAFFGRTSLFQPDKKKPAVLAESATGGGDFQSVFTDVEATSLPRVPLGDMVFPDPPLPPGGEYRVKPDPKNKNLQPVPTHSRRDQVAAAVTESDNAAFQRNIANRLWALLMGRGLVEPLDFHHASNPPTHPELLTLLAEEFAGMNHDIRAFLRELALSDTYQRGSVMPAPEQLVAQADALAPSLAGLEAEETHHRAASQAASDALDHAKEMWIEARKSAIGPESAWRAAEDKRVAAAIVLSTAGEALDAAEKLREELIARTAEGVDDPGLVKAEAAVKAAREKMETADVALASATAAAGKLLPAVEAEQAKVAKVTRTLEIAQRDYDATKTVWKLSQRKWEDARALVDHVALLRGGDGDGELAARQARQEEVGRLRLVAQRLEAAAVGAQELREEFLDDDDLVLAASVIGERSLAAHARVDAAERALQELRNRAAAARMEPEILRERVSASSEELTSRWARAFAAGAITHLTPEQFCGAMLQATGELGKIRLAAEAEFSKKLAATKGKDDGKDAPPPLVESDRARHVEEAVQTRVAAITNQFVSLFGGEAGLPQTDFYATADQALFLSNADTPRGWLRPSGENLSARLLKMTDPETVAVELYLSVLTREPDPEEIAAVADYLAARDGQRAEAVQELAWALLSSVEFRFKH